jgi:hypothetical protein
MNSPNSSLSKNVLNNSSFENYLNILRRKYLSRSHKLGTRHRSRNWFEEISQPCPLKSQLSTKISTFHENQETAM